MVSMGTSSKEMVDFPTNRVSLQEGEWGYSWIFSVQNGDQSGCQWAEVGKQFGCQTDVIPETKVKPWPAQWAGYHFDGR